MAEHYHLGVPEMDQTHDAFVDLVERLDQASGEIFTALFKDLLHHTEAHFDNETRLMEQYGFPAIREHRDEHQRVLGDLRRLKKRIDSGSTLMARAYIREQLPDWFDLHLQTMDSALAAHLKRQPFPANQLG